MCCLSPSTAPRPGRCTQAEAHASAERAHNALHVLRRMALLPRAQATLARYAPLFRELTSLLAAWHDHGVLLGGLGVVRALCSESPKWGPQHMAAFRAVDLLPTLVALIDPRDSTLAQVTCLLPCPPPVLPADLGYGSCACHCSIRATGIAIALSFAACASPLS